MSKPAANPYDAIVIGASLGGLAAVALLTRAGRKVLLLEEQAAPPEPVGPIQALDPVLLSELRLSARGLRFFARDLPLALPNAGTSGLVLERNPHDAQRALAPLGATEAAAWLKYRSELHALARPLRRWWWSGLDVGAPDWVLDSDAQKARFARLCLMGADAFLAEYFQSEALIAALLFDASIGGLHVSEPGSALALVWSAAQEMGGLEGAAAMAVPGTLVWSLIKAAGDTDFRCCARAAGLILRDGAAVGVRLDGGEKFYAPLIFSSLAVGETPGLSQGALSTVGEARLLVSLRQPMALPATRLILAEQPEIYLAAHEAAREGRLAAEVPIEVTATGPDKIAIVMRPVPARLNEEQRDALAALAVKTLSRQMPGLAATVSGSSFAVQGAITRAHLAQMLSPAALRVKTAIAGLYLCGADAEPVPALSGRAARLAVQLALAAPPAGT